jgi:hypothetical protein
VERKAQLDGVDGITKFADLEADDDIMVAAVKWGTKAHASESIG